MNKKKSKKTSQNKTVRASASPTATSSSNEYVPIPINKLDNEMNADSSEIFDFIPELKGKKY